MQLENRFHKTAMPTLNVCPGFGIIHTISAENAERLDRTDNLAGKLASKMARRVDHS